MDDHGLYGKALREPMVTLMKSALCHCRASAWAGVSAGAAGVTFVGGGAARPARVMTGAASAGEYVG